MKSISSKKSITSWISFHFFGVDISIFSGIPWDASITWRHTGCTDCGGGVMGELHPRKEGGRGWALDWKGFWLVTQNQHGLFEDGVSFFYVQNQQSVSSFLPLEWLFCGVYAILAIWLDFITHSCWNAMGLKVPSSAVDLCIRVRLTWLVTNMNRWTSPRCQVGSQNEAHVKLWQFDWEHMDILVQIQGFQNMRQPQACIKSFLNMIAAAKSRTCSPGIVKCHVSSSLQFSKKK